MPLMGSLYIGVSGLQTSQNALNTTAHNISNLDTTGYVRQQILQGTATYNTILYNNKSVANQQIGLGVVYTRTRQVRDTFLDSTYRKESGRSAFYEVSYDAIGEIESLLDELNGETFEESIQDLWTSVQELAKDPSSAVTQGLFVERCSEFLARAQSVYDGLKEYQSSLNETVKVNVENINDIAQRIKTLNDEIRNIEISNVARDGGITFEKANDLRDERNALLDELSKYGNITYSEDTDCTVWVQLEGEDLVRGEIAYKIGLYEKPDTGFYTPFWEKNAKFTYDADGNKKYSEEEAKKAQVFDLKRVISSDLNTDIGALKSALLARGDHAANYTDLLIDRYDYEISQSVCMNVMAEFDQLIHGITTTINKVIADAAEAAHKTNPSSHYLMTYNDNLKCYVPIQVFQKIASEGYSSDGAGGYVFNEEKVGEYNPETGRVTGYLNESLYTTTNILVNSALLQQPTKLGFVLIDGSVDYSTMEVLKAAFENEETTLNPNVKKKSSYVDYYGDLVSQIANSGYVYKSLLDSQEATVAAAENAREQIIGVSEDEELTYMVKFQNAYNASSRYINVVDEMLEHIINTLGT